MTRTGPNPISQDRLLEARFDGPIPGHWLPARVDNPGLTRGLMRRRMEGLRQRMAGCSGSDASTAHRRELLAELWEILALPEGRAD